MTVNILAPGLLHRRALGRRSASGRRVRVRTDGSAGARGVDRQPEARQQLGEARVLTDGVDSDADVEAYRREAGFLHIAASPKPVEREVNIAERDAHQTQIERRNERGARQPFGFRHASSRFASFVRLPRARPRRRTSPGIVRGRTFRLDELL